ncbi:tetratricopeptide repeat protein [Candidatus Thiodictyon syntrophicum]|jgi:tetratricopeptide (TPR) repeat protein|uniref:MalT-like TPR region domain-containing protein n=1 Tax=Candidatus Thiodictyon syntrophicum TaxID=1166950 RepID=A0A2K8UE36_9GAMM|nr:tetratricopeptide repeat protein [Candidatus Thiodictyon syntrophicum]AUB83351.1 hypothetical protein THSYN_22015 [Candidatus Thiodictyon syntrophicum]
MDIEDTLIERLTATQGDVQAQAAIMAEFRLSVYPEPERRALREALDAAAVLHWFDAGLLAQVLAIPAIEARGRFERPQGLSFVEHYGRPDRGLFNVHEATRLGWRRRLAAQDPGRLRELSDRAAACFAGDQTTAGRIEWVYHLLCADADAGAGALESMNRDWVGGARPEDFAALARALRELDSTGLVAGRARAWTLLIGAWSRHLRGETAQLAETAAEALQLARDAADRPAESDAQSLLGCVWEPRGQLTAAQAAFGESLAIIRRLAERDPSNAGWQRELAVAHSNVGDVLQAQGQLAAAQAAFGETLGIIRRRAEQDPGNTGWQRDLAVAHCRVGGVLQAQGELAAAQAAFGEYLAISRRLAERDPGNAGWQRELAVAHSRVGDVLQAQGQSAAAQAAFGEYLAISRRLAEQDPGNAGWQRDLAVAHGRVGDVLQAQGQLAAAQAAFGETLAISRRLAEQDPGNAGWQLDLAVAHSRVGGVLQAQGQLPAAQAAFGESLAISRRLAEQDPSNADWQRDLAVSCVDLARIEAAIGKSKEALRLFEESARIYAAVVRDAPDVRQWADERAAAQSEFASYRSKLRRPRSKDRPRKRPR